MRLDAVAVGDAVGEAPLDRSWWRWRAYVQENDQVDIKVRRSAR